MTDLTNAQRCALISARNTGNATSHLSGRSEMGGWERTRISLMQKGLIDRFSKITPAGMEALQQFETATRKVPTPTSTEAG
jgi:hypothetical protein